MGYLKKTDILILAISAAIFIFSSYLLYDDSLLFQQKITSEFEEIGFISQKVKDVRRKNSTNFMWLPIRENDKVYQHDSLFTGDDSTAQITFLDGTKIDISSNSLVDLNIEEEQMNLNLKFGNFVGQIAPNTTLNLKTGQDTVQLTSEKKTGAATKVELKKQLGGEVKVKVIEGKVNISKDQVIKALNINERLELKEQTDLSKMGVEKIVLNPWIRFDAALKSEYRLRTNEVTSFNFVWERNPDIPLSRLEFASEPTFKSPQTLYEGAEKVFKWENLPKEGRTFARLAAIDSDKKIVAFSKTIKFDLYFIKVPLVTNPTEGQTFKIKKNRDGETISYDRVKFEWTYEVPKCQYEYEFSKNNLFTEIISKQSKLKKQEFVTTPLAEGWYYFRVRATLPSKEVTPWSQPRLLEVNYDLPNGKFPPPVLVNPIVDYKPPVLKGLVAENDESPEVKWKPVDEAKNYLFQFSKDKAFTTPTEVTTENLSLFVNNYQFGKQFFRLFSITAKGLKSDASQIGEINIKVDKPILANIPQLDYMAKTFDEKPTSKNFEVSWNTVPLAQSYKVQFSKNDQFTQLQEVVAPKSPGTLVIPLPGDYKVRVLALDKNSVQISDYSDPKSLIYTMDWPLKTPKLIDPLDKMTVYLQDDSSPYIWLYWEKVPEALSYVIEVSTDENFKKLLYQQSIEPSKFLIKQKLSVGNIYWRVKAVKRKVISEWSKVRSFTLYTSKGG
jgi:hypothetical protein